MPDPETRVGHRGIFCPVCIRCQLYVAPEISPPVTSYDLREAAQRRTETVITVIRPVPMSEHATRITKPTPHNPVESEGAAIAANAAPKAVLRLIVTVPAVRVAGMFMR
ncbi:hypothetical protein [Corynebacterium efficiens YS-314]|uniref:Uncharacterized protein n=1 Tax=Corynebacterium efficiens (strain DSM 44549 / YS-314 / AJ 12310 / JCM 11189 / NBRC 100395) TaxID=196164 RepID=Q8FMZ7_COREF|nr:hypothetical protein [Corynebacterium efficiens YS-314]